MYHKPTIDQDSNGKPQCNAPAEQVVLFPLPLPPPLALFPFSSHLLLELFRFSSLFPSDVFLFSNTVLVELFYHVEEVGYVRLELIKTVRYIGGCRLDHTWI
jgi:hypothetical protein